MSSESEKSDERELLSNDFIRKSSTCEDAEKRTVTINEAIETAGFGCGTLFFCLGPFLLFCFDGAEIVVLSIVGLSVKCEWNLTSFWVATLQESVLFGMMISSLVTNFAGDRWGRKSVGIVGGVGLIASGVASGFSAVYWQLLVLRVLLGTLVGLVVGPCTAITAEFATRRTRSFLVSYVALAWGVGVSLTSLLAFFIMEPFGWRGLLIGAALLFSPAPLFLAVSPESPRFDAKMGKWEAAERTLKKLAKLNCKSSEKCNFTLQREEGEIKEPDNQGLFHRAPSILKQIGKVKEFLTILALGFSSLFVYYTLAYSMPRFLNEGFCNADEAILSNTNHTSTEQTVDDCEFQKSVLFDLGVISLFEPLGVLMAAIFVDIVGRKRVFFSSIVGIMLSQTALYFCVNRNYTMIFFILAKFFAAQLAWSTFLLGAEGFPTEIRSFVLAVSVGTQRLGGIFGIACSQFVFDLNPRFVLLSIQVGALMSGGCLFALKYDATGRQID